MTLTLPREAAARFRAVARKCHIGRPRGPDPPVRVQAVAGTATLFVQLPEVALAYTVPCTEEAAGSGFVPMDALDVNGPVSIELALPPGRRHRRAVTDGPLPLPDDLIGVPHHFLAALHEAGRTAAREPSRYAVTRIQVQGTGGKVVGTDGKQALIWGGFSLPFSADVLVPAVPMFGAKELAAQTDVRAGRTSGHLVVSAGPWTVWLSNDDQGRFPDVGGAVPRTRLATTLELDESDAGSLLEALHRLRASDDRDTQVTVELAPIPVVRVSGKPDGPPSKVTLARSVVTGPSVVIGVYWRHMVRAIGLGLRRLRFAGTDRPWVGSNDSCTYLSATLPAEATSHPSMEADGIERTSPTASPSSTPETENPMPGHHTGNGHPAHENNGSNNDSPDVLEAAETLKTNLAEAHASAARLVAALKAQRRQRRTVETALASLRSLRLE